MHTPRPAVLRHARLMGCILIGSLFLSAAQPGRAQQAVRPSPGSVHLRPLTSGGQPLPAGTAIALLTRDAGASAVLDDSTWAALDSLDALNAVQRDTLGAAGATRRAYARSAIAGRLYFVLAATPDNRLYWSYNPARDAPLFEVVSSGNLFVAPLPDTALTAAADLLMSPPATGAIPSTESTTSSASGGTVFGVAPVWLLSGFLLLALALGALTGIAAFFIFRERSSSRGDVSNDETFPPAKLEDEIGALQEEMADLRNGIVTLNGFLNEAIPKLDDRLNMLEGVE